MDALSHQTINEVKKIGRSVRDSISLKLVVIGMLILALLIPSAWVQDLIQERQARAQGAITEVAAKWSGSQTLSGPVLVVPYKTTQRVAKGNSQYVIQETIEKAFFLSKDLQINGNISPLTLHRGIFDAVVYSAAINMKADFSAPDFKALNIDPAAALWEEAQLVLPVADLAGIYNDLEIAVDGKKIEPEPTQHIGMFVPKPIDHNGDSEATQAEGVPEFTSSGIVIKLTDMQPEGFKGNVTVKLNIKGSDALNFVPTGRSTTVALKGSWTDPSFTGKFLPTERKVTNEGFSARWSLLHFNRPFAQQWTGVHEKLESADFGLKLLMPVDQYQKSMRTSKYGKLIIILTFVALLFVEIIRKIRIHPFQYILIGAALIIYYSLLLSISEQLGYTWAYWMATAATVTLISLYASSFLKNSVLVILFTFLLSVFYAFIYVIILQQDFSLLIGSVGLFIVVAALMFFSRKVVWYKETSAEIM